MSVSDFAPTLFVRRRSRRRTNANSGLTVLLIAFAALVIVEAGIVISNAASTLDDPSLAFVAP